MKFLSFELPFSCFAAFILFSLITLDVAYGADFDVEAAGKAMFNPIISFIDAWYGTGIFAAGVSGAIVSTGDLRTRALGFGMGSVIAGLTLLGVKAGFDVKAVSHYSNFV